MRNIELICSVHAAAKPQWQPLTPVKCGAIMGCTSLVSPESSENVGCSLVQYSQDLRGIHPGDSTPEEFRNLKSPCGSIIVTVAVAPAPKTQPSGDVYAVPSAYCTRSPNTGHRDAQGSCSSLR